MPWYIGSERMDDCLNRRREHHLGDVRNFSKYRKQSSDRLTIRHEAPNACGGMLLLNFDFTTPEFPWGRVTRLQFNHQFEFFERKV